MADRVAVVLSQAGWSEGRAVPTAAAERALSALGYPVTDHLRSFLSSYSGLAFDRAELIDSTTWIDGEEAANELSHGWPEGYSAAAGKRLVPVGEYGPMMILVDADSGDLWGGFDHEFGRLGATFAEALETMLWPPPWLVLNMKLASS